MSVSLTQYNCLIQFECAGVRLKDHPKGDTHTHTPPKGRRLECAGVRLKGGRTSLFAESPKGGGLPAENISARSLQLPQLKTSVTSTARVLSGKKTGLCFTSVGRHDEHWCIDPQTFNRKAKYGT